MKKLALVGLLLVACLVGCKSDPLVGKWAITEGGNSAMAMDAEFTAPDKVAVAMDYFGKAKIKFVGSYKMVGDQLTTTFTDCSLDYTGEKADVVQQAFTAQKEGALKKMNEDPTGTVVWDGKDKFTLTAAKDKSHPMTFTRAAK